MKIAMLNRRKRAVSYVAVILLFVNLTAINFTHADEVVELRKGKWDGIWFSSGNREYSHEMNIKIGRWKSTIMFKGASSSCIGKKTLPVKRSKDEYSISNPFELNIGGECEVATVTVTKDVYLFYSRFG